MSYYKYIDLDRQKPIECLKKKLNKKEYICK